MKAALTDSTTLLTRIKQLTTPLGIYQFSKGDEPDPSYGYALDDQVRALIVVHELGDKELTKIYQDFIVRAQRPDGLFYQFCDQEGKFMDNSSAEETVKSQEAYGETLWALFKTGLAEKKELKPIAQELLRQTQKWQSPRAMAEALLGLTALEKETPLERKFTRQLISLFEHNATPEWPWFENILTYANPILPWALWEVGQRRGHNRAREVAEKATRFLIDVCQKDGVPHPIGTDGWYPKGGQKALFDQQPIDASYMVCCLEKAFLVTQNPYFKQWAKKWWGWFWGDNLLKAKLVNENFACADGLSPVGASKNQGAESTICFLMAWLAAHRLGFC